MSPWPLSLDDLANVLRAEGWDVVVSEDVIARREDVPGVWVLYADQAGRLRLEATRELGTPQGRRLHQHGREYRVLCETHEVVNVFTTIARVDELPVVLRTLEDMLRRRLWEEHAMRR